MLTFTWLPLINFLGGKAIRGLVFQDLVSVDCGAGAGAVGAGAVGGGAGPVCGNAVVGAAAAIVVVVVAVVVVFVVAIVTGAVGATSGSGAGGLGPIVDRRGAATLLRLPAPLVGASSSAATNRAKGCKHMTESEWTTSKGTPCAKRAVIYSGGLFRGGSSSNILQSQVSARCELFLVTLVTIRLLNSAGPKKMTL